ncbi:PhoD-like phosphatase [Lusitaniella coriacea]|uniref:PhoD-like phosphatase n=1 Tax=Lusitaniella coriacea TaxID=1983105 RepID=UPI003CF0D88F
MLFSLEELPLILTGPLLRRTEPDAVTVWLALKAARQVTLRVYRAEERMTACLAGTRSTVRLGEHFHIVAVTATSEVNARLEPGQLYAYDLDFGEGGESLNEALNSTGCDAPLNLSYFEHGLPTFALPPDDLNHLKIVHGSCRKPHGGGADMLPLMDNAIAQAADFPNERPHQLFLTGDQIYSDDVADPLLWLASELEVFLLGWEEDLLLPDNSYKPRELKPGQRSSIAEECAGFTAGLPNQAHLAKSHLFAWGEYCIAYLLCWSSVLWPDKLPSGKEMCQEKKQVRQWDREVDAIANFTRSLGQVRRLLANIPTYTICDDHDVSDDWYLNREWCDRVLGKSFGRKVVQNALLGYALFQGWGNTPKQFFAGQPGEKLLGAVETWSASKGKDKAAWREIGKYLGLPLTNPQTGLPQYRRDGDVLILDRDDRALDWHYTIRGFKHEAIVIDTRTWRGYPPGEKEKKTPPMLLCPTGFEQQLEAPLGETEAINQSQQAEIEATLVILPTNLVTMCFVDWVQRFDLSRDRVFGNDVGDSWNFNENAFSQFLVRLGQRRDRAIILSGDIHYSCAVRLCYWSRERDSVLVQLTSSALKNSEWSTRLIHTKLKSLCPERTVRWAGWKTPPPLREMAILPGQIKQWNHQTRDRSPFLRQLHRDRGNEQLSWKLILKDPKDRPDWRYRIQWLERGKAQLLPWHTPRNQHPKLSENFLIKLLLKLWRNRWLQEGSEVVGRNNFSLVTFQWSPQNSTKAVIQETYWFLPDNPTRTVTSRYFVSLEPDKAPPFTREL